MQSQQFKRITFLGVVVLLMASGIEERASCLAADSWEDHPVITPIPLVADGRTPITRPKSKKLTSITEAAVPFETTLPESVFPLRWSDRRSKRKPRRTWRPVPWCRRETQAPRLSELSFAQSDTETGDWWKPWFSCDAGISEWSPLRLAGLGVEDRAVPEQIVPYVTINDDKNWFRFRFVYPTKSPTENRFVKFDLAQLKFQEDTTWLDRLRIYRLSVYEIRDAGSPRAIVMANLTEGYDVIEVDATKISDEFDPIGIVQPNYSPQSQFDKWLGETRTNMAPKYGSFETGLTR